MREYTAIIYTLKGNGLLIFGSKHLTVSPTDHKPIIFIFTQKPNANHRVYRIQTFLKETSKLTNSLESR